LLTSGCSAIDIVLLNILGKVSGQAICKLLGRASRDFICTGNTSAGYGYVRDISKNAGRQAPQSNPVARCRSIFRYA
jgi:L-alanine-DL-glutamate epimerase-like enolase superfamily enzyme